MSPLADIVADPGTGLGLAEVAAFNAALLLAVLGPGPAFLLCTDAALTGGRRAGVTCGLGLALVAGLWTLAALAGLEALFDAVPAAYTALKIGGAVLVLFFAVQIWRGSDGTAPPRATPASRRRAFVRGVLLNLGNPKSILFSAGVLLVIFPPDLSAAEMAFVTANHVLLEAAVYAGLSVVIAREAVRRRYLAAKRTIDRAMALLLGGLGLRLLVSS